MFCIRCGRQIADDCNLCGYCGMPVPRNVIVHYDVVPKRKDQGKLIISVISAIVAALLIISLVVTNFFTVTVWVETTSNTQMSSGENITTVHLYDEKGRLSEYYYDTGKDNDDHYYLTYNIDGRIQEIEYVGMVQVYTYEYGKVAKVDTQLDGRTIASTSYTYDRNGRLVEETTNYSYKIEPECIAYEYDSSGRLIRETYTSEAREGGRDIVEYSYKGGKLVSRQNRGGKEDRWRVEYRYNILGRLAESVSYTNNVEESRTLYKYDIYGNLIKAETYTDGRLTSWTSYTWEKVKMTREQAIATCKDFGEGNVYRFSNRIRKSAGLEQKNLP